MSNNKSYDNMTFTISIFYNGPLEPKEQIYTAADFLQAVRYINYLKQVVKNPFTQIRVETAPDFAIFEGPIHLFI